MRSSSLSVCRHFVLGFSFMVAAAASGAPRGDRLPPPDKDPSARGSKMTICHRSPNGAFSSRSIPPSTLQNHLGHGDCLIDDNIACTSDSCHATLGCVHTPNDSLCDDGLFCTTESCTAGGCAAVSTCPPSIDGCVHRNDSCDEDANTCVDRPDDGLCEDGLFCTEDSCNAETGACGTIDKCPAFVDTENCLVYGRCDETNQDCPADPLTPCCGDGVCESGENICTCFSDCSQSSGICGDGCCSDLERAGCTCPTDCATICGDSCCDAGEDACSCGSDCQPTCGDGCCNGGEDALGCPADCVVCGDGVCDSGEDTSNCPTDCPTVCGNGIAETGEACDDGNTDACDGCSPDCTTENSCGDGCCVPGETTSNCPTDCPAVCGNGIAETGEACDDGNTDACDGCSPDCTTENSCGDGCCVPGETTSNCPTDCPAVCGNGIAETGEACDDGNTDACDGCSPDCTTENSCGDGCCVPGENICTCFSDCSQSSGICGDGCCSDLERAGCTCPTDCATVCGDSCCDASEDTCSCPADCGSSVAGGGGGCGDGLCCAEFSENSCTCPDDCLPDCGDGCCNGGEDGINCPADCCNPTDASCTLDSDCCSTDCSGNVCQAP